MSNAITERRHGQTGSIRKEATTEAFYLCPDTNPPSAAVSADVPDDPNKCAMAITDGQGNFFCAGLELQYDEEQSADVEVTIAVPDGWSVVECPGGTSWTKELNTNSYYTLISYQTINKVVNKQIGLYMDPFLFKSGQNLYDPAIRVTRPPSDNKGHPRR